MKSYRDSPHLLEAHVLEHLDQFMVEASLYPKPGERALVGVSGGVDSMVLAWALTKLFQRKKDLAPVWVHINHGTREGCSSEEELVKKLARSWNCPLEIFHLKLERRANFESKARKMRYECFRKALKEFNSKNFYLGHNIDDSFEWHLLQQFRSSEYPGAIGIPVVNGVFKRPLHCLSKKQLYQIANVLGIPYCEDESNSDQAFERNFIRHSIVTKIQDRYPSYLKNYVVKANQMAKTHGLSAFRYDPEASLIQDSLGGVCLLQPKGRGTFRGQEEKIREAIFLLSQSERGKVRNQVQKLIRAQQQGRFGPMQMSGGVQVFMGPGSLLMLAPRQLEAYRQWDQDVASYLRTFSASQITEGLLNPRNWELSLNQLVAPFWIVGSPEQASHLFKSSLQNHPLFPQLFETCRTQNLWIRPMGQVLSLCHRKSLNPKSFGLVPLAMV